MAKVFKRQEEIFGAFRHELSPIECGWKSSGSSEHKKGAKNPFSLPLTLTLSPKGRGDFRGNCHAPTGRR